MAIGPWQIVIIALVILLLFGGNRLGEIGKGLGEGIKNFKKGLADDEKEPPRLTSGDSRNRAQHEEKKDQQAE